MIESRGIIDESRLTLVDNIHDGTPEEINSLKEMVGIATKYLEGFRWCKRINRMRFGIGCPGIFAVCLAEIENSASPRDNKLWVVDGDIPSAYLVTDEANSPEAALSKYIAEMTLWIDRVRAGEGLEGVIPVNVAPTKNAANDLAKRLKFLADNFL